MVPFVFALSPNTAAIDSISVMVDGRFVSYGGRITAPGSSIARLEVDTRMLANGSHTVSLVGSNMTSEITDSFALVTSGQINVTVANSCGFPDWDDQAELAAHIRMLVPPSPPSYTLSFFNSLYPKAIDPFAPSINPSSFTGLQTDGTITYSASPSALGMDDGDVDPTIYSFTELYSASGQGQTVANPGIRQSPPYPPLGLWAAAYADNIADMGSYIAGPTYMLRWMHDVMLDQGWLRCGVLAGSPTIAALPSPSSPESAQTWPVRMQDGKAYHRMADVSRLVSYLGNPAVRNFFGFAHGTLGTFLNMEASTFAGYIKHRYRFAFLDGCVTGLGGLLSAFGADRTELALPAYPPQDVQPPPALQTTLDYYTGNKRPGAFLGWKVFSKSRYPVTPAVQDPVTLNQCNWRTYEAMCNWHAQLLFYWTVQGETLLRAIDHANEDAMGVLSDPPNWLETAYFFSSTGAPIYLEFTPATCLRVYGYGALRFNEYNHATNLP